MTTNEIFQTLKNQGFDVKVKDNDVVVSLNRPISTMEVWTALDLEIEQDHILKSGKNVVVIGQE